MFDRYTRHESSARICTGMTAHGSAVLTPWHPLLPRARDRKSNRICALKKIKMDKEKDGFPLTSIREINILLSFHHPNIVNVSEVAVGASLDSVYMAMEIMDHDLKALLEHKDTPFTIPEVCPRYCVGILNGPSPSPRCVLVLAQLRRGT